MTSDRVGPGRVRRAAAAAVVGGVVIVAAACGSGADRSTIVETNDPGRPAAEALARASETTGAVETGRMRATYTVSGVAGGESIDATMVAEGAFADFGRQAELTIDMTPMLGQMGDGQDVPDSFVVREIVDGTTVYLRMDLGGVGSDLGLGGWMKMDVGELDQAPTGLGGLTGGMTGGPQGFLESTKGAGATVEQTGEDEIDGAHVTVYAGSIDPQDAVAQADPDKADEVRQLMDQMGMTASFPFTAYVDDDGMVRRLEMTMEMTVAGSTMRMAGVIDLYDFGAPVTITPPSADEVRDLSSMFGSLMQSS